MIKKILTIIALSVCVFLAPAAALADDSQIYAVCKINPGASICPGKGTTSDPVIHVLNVATAIVALMAGIAAVIIIIISGISMITSSGNQDAVANARKRLLAAVVGLVIVALAWVIISFVINKLIK